jgi:hypothetical protein
MLAAAVIAASALSGAIGGVGLAAFGLALLSKAITVLTVEQAETLLVVGPLAGLLPVSCLLLAARHEPRIARLLPAALGVWFACGTVSFAWLGLSPALR